MTARPALVVSLLAAALSVAPLPAHAEPPPTPKADPSDEDLERATELFENGKELYSEGSYDAAIAAFRRAYQASGDPVLLYNIALAHDRAGRYDEAIEYFGYYRAFAPASERKALAEKVESLRKRKLREQSDAAARGEDPDAPPDDLGDDDRGPATDPEPVTDPTPPPPGPTDTAPQKPLFGPAEWTLSALALVGAGVGTGLGIAALRRRDDAQAACLPDASGRVVCPDSAQGDVDATRGMAIGADVAFAVAGAAAIAVIVLVATKAAKRKSSASARVAPHGTGLTIHF
jgi:tetratricopeptide (TPR) repeat protein